MKITFSPLLAEAVQMPPELLAKNAKLSDPEKLAEVTRQFEAVLLRQILSNARKVAHPSKFNPETVSEGIYQDLVTHQLADMISRKGGLGLAETFREQLARQGGPDPNTSAEAVESTSP